MKAMVSNSATLRYRSGLLDTAGNPAHAASYLRRRSIVLDEELKGAPAEHRRVLEHELYHFVWVRLGNAARRDWEDVVTEEWRARARGEAGWSAEWRKRLLGAADVEGRTRKWREYCCESFCDTGAWFESGVAGEVTLAPGRMARRRAWFERRAARFATLKPQCLVSD